MVQQWARTGAVALALALAAVACGSSDEPRVPSVPEGRAQGGADSGSPRGAASATGGAPVDDIAEYIEAVRGWVGCLRARGVDVSDPDHLGVVTFANPGAKANPDQMAAQEQCRQLLPPVPESVLELRRPRYTPAQIEQRRRYARCMQENGAPDFPDPGPDGYTGRDEPGSEQWDPTTPGARRAASLCAPIIGDPATPGQTRG